MAQFVKEISENKRSDQWNRTVLRLLPSMISQFKLQEKESDESQEFVDKINLDVLPAMFRLLHKAESTNPANNETSQKKLMKHRLQGLQLLIKFQLNNPCVFLLRFQLVN